jgi:hypothetical protein
VGKEADELQVLVFCLEMAGRVSWKEKRLIMMVVVVAVVELTP